MVALDVVLPEDPENSLEYRLLTERGYKYSHVPGLAHFQACDLTFKIGDGIL